MAICYAKQTTFSAFLLQDILDPAHPLVKLAEIIDWEAIHDNLRPYYCVIGRQALPIRLMVGLHLLKHQEGMSDHQVTERIRGDLYWMYFCGVDPDSLTGVYSHLDCSSMTKFRNRVGEKGFARVESVIRQYLFEKKIVDTHTMTTDSSCLEKHIAYPTDSGLLDKGRKNVLFSMKKLENLGVKGVRGLRTFVRSSKKLVLLIAKLGKGRQERIKKCTLELAKMASHVVRKSKKMLSRYRRALKRGTLRQLSKARAAARALRTQTEILSLVIKQARQRYRGKHLKKKIYSLHEPEVVCIRKGKKSRPNEYGIKFNLSVDKRGFIISHEETTKNVHDAKLLEPALKNWEKTTGNLPIQFNGDRGYVQQEHRKTRRMKNIRRLCIPSRGKKRNPEADTTWFRTGQRQRAQIEGTIGYLKSKGRCRYKGNRGSKIHLSLGSTCWNLGKVTRNYL